MKNIIANLQWPSFLLDLQSSALPVDHGPVGQAIIIKENQQNQTDQATWQLINMTTVCSCCDEFCKLKCTQIAVIHCLCGFQ